jgi:hypothetical protein
MRIEQAYEDLLRREIEAEKTLQRIKKQQADEAAAAAAEEEAKARRMRELVNEMMKESALFNAQGEPFTEKQRAERLANVQRQMEEFQQIASSGSKWQVTDLLNFAGFKQKMELAFKESTTTIEIEGLKVAPEKLVALNHQITHGLGEIELRIGAAALDPSKMRGKTVPQQLQEYSRQIQEAERTMDALVRKQQEADRDLRPPFVGKRARQEEEPDRGICQPFTGERARRVAPQNLLAACDQGGRGRFRLHGLAVCGTICRGADSRFD